LIGGKSTLQNELLGCTGKFFWIMTAILTSATLISLTDKIFISGAEFGPAPDKAEERSLGKLGRCTPTKLHCNYWQADECINLATCRKQNANSFCYVLGA
jgi:hypothetical protein